MQLTPPEDRVQLLLAAGLPAALLAAIDDPTCFAGLAWWARPPDGARYDLPKLPILPTPSVTPVFDDPNGDRFWVLCDGSFGSLILESDALRSLGTAQELLEDLLTRWYEGSDPLPIEDLRRYAGELGIERGAAVLDALQARDR